MNENIFFLFDNVYFDHCNIRCKYCRPNLSVDKIFISIKEKIEVLRRIRKETEELIKKGYKFGVFKVSGYGEISLLKKHLSEILINLEDENQTPVNQIITNGTLLTKSDIRKIKDLSQNIIFNISLDGHTIEMNINRFGKNTKLLRATLDTLNNLIEYEIPTEVILVITKHNINNIINFFNYLLDNGYIKPYLVVFPQVVRNFSTSNNSNLLPRREEMIKLRSQLDKNFSQLEEVLPPREYLEHMFSTYFKGRSLACYNPITVFNIDPNLSTRICSCGPLDIYKSLSEVNSLENLVKIFLNERWKYLSRFVNGSCYRCFTHFDVINLYLGDFINENALIDLPMFRLKSVLNVLRDLKELINKKRGVYG